jgi:hypothetical protein
MHATTCSILHSGHEKGRTVFTVKYGKLLHCSLLIELFEFLENCVLLLNFLFLLNVPLTHFLLISSCKIGRQTTATRDELRQIVDYSLK